MRAGTSAWALFAAFCLAGCASPSPHNGQGRRVGDGLGWQEPDLATRLEEEALVANYSKQIAALPQAIMDSYKHEGGRSNRMLRPQHAKMLAGFSDARLAIPADLDPDFRVGWLVPGRSYTVTVRFSNASGVYLCNDAEPDLRGIALRIDVGTDGYQDLLLTNAPVHHAKNAKQALASVAAPAHKSGLAKFHFLAQEVGLFETVRIARHVKRQMKVPVDDLATESFYSRGAYAFGNRAARFALVPTVPKPDDSTGEGDLSGKLASTLRSRPVVYDLKIQRFDTEETTPVELGNADWGQRFEETIATLTIPQNAVNDPGVDAVRFNPFNLSSDRRIRPIGSLNRIRAPVYQRRPLLGGR